MATAITTELNNATSASFSPEETLEYLVKNGIIDQRGVEIEMRNARRKSLLAQHNYTVYQGKDGRWYSYLPDEDKGRKKIVKATRESLEDVICEFYEVQNNPTLRSLFPQWLKFKDIFVKKNTIKRFQTDWERFYDNAEIVDYPIKELTKNQLEVWVRSVAKERNMDYKQYTGFVSILKQELEYAEEMEIIKDSPFRRVHVKSRQLRSKTIKPDSCKVYSIEELARLRDMMWESFDNESRRYHRLAPLAVLFMFLTGLRIGEVTGLKFEDVYDNKMLVRRMVEYPSGDIVEDTKGAFGQRFVLLVPEALELIEKARAYKEEKGVEIDFIFSMVDEPIKTYYAIQRIFKDCCKKMGIVVKSSHKARMTYISTCIDEGINAHTVAKQVGHKDVRTTLNNYYFDRDDEKEQISKLQAALCS